MTHIMEIDRFEGVRKQIAVLVTSDGRSIDVFRDLLPRDARAGDVLKVSLELDLEAAQDVVNETRRLRSKLTERDPGGDLKL